MGWETRKGKRYYYRARRDDTGRVVKEYCGAGTNAKLAAQNDLDERKARERDRMALEELKLKLADADRLMKSLDAGCEMTMEAVLLANNFYKHQSEWRRRNVRKQRTGND